MFITNETALKDPAILAAMESIRRQELAEAQRRQAIREGRIPAPQVWGRFEISDRHWSGQGGWQQPPYAVDFGRDNRGRGGVALMK